MSSTLPKNGLWSSLLAGVGLALVLSGCAGGEGVEESGSNGTTGDTTTETGEPTDSGTTAADTFVMGDALVLNGDTPTNLLIVSVDTLRADYVYGEIEEGLSPFIEGLAEEGLKLDDHLSCSNWTVPSFYCLFTGRTTLDIGVHPLSSDMKLLPEAEVTLAERFRRIGAWGALVSANPLISYGLGLIQGFHLFDSMPNAPAESVTDRALEVLAEAEEGKPWYAQIHYYDPHAAYSPPESYLEGIEELEPIEYDLTDIDSINEMRAVESELTPAERELIAEHAQLYYRGEVRYLDDQIARLFDGLDEMGMLDGTLVLFVADHGEQLFDHGQFQHLRDLFREEVRVPAIFWMKGGGVEPGVHTGITMHEDVVPTLAGVFDLGTGGNGDLAGLPIGEAPLDRIALSLHGVARGSAVLARRGYDELIYRFDNSVEIYDVATDPGEVNDLYSESHPLIGELLPVVEEAAAKLVTSGGVTPPE